MSLFVDELSKGTDQPRRLLSWQQFDSSRKSSGEELFMQLITRRAEKIPINKINVEWSSSF